ncbi:MAG: hypothetical protein PHS80_02705 [Methanothrix sp.]|nr:hypothetical protein [Methanothrix sp.]
MDIFTPELAARVCVEVLVASSSSIHEKVWVVKNLGRYAAGGYMVHQALLEGLKDSHPAVRSAAYASLTRMHLDRWELLEVAREIRKTLELEEEGSPAWFAGMKALDKLRDYYEVNFNDIEESC